ncbi:MAG TPA: acetylxylan esterase [Planctomycetota bacterium]|nr:acetylxylan esterase [Planctomycetota bacterium]
MQTLILVLALTQSSWDMEALGKAPKSEAAPGFEVEGLKAITYDGPLYQGKPTRVFAWLGLPKAEGKVPAMVLLHGGGGTAFSDWVKLWTGRGYAAISMDLCGCVPRKQKNGWERLEQGGPPGWGGFEQIDGDERDQWTWQAVADAILAHSLIRSRPEVDADRVGVTGISWGGYLTCITAGVDRRFKFAAPVYGCGFLGEDSTWLDTFAKMGKEKADKWLGLWDPSRYLKQATMPFLWVNGTNDFAYPLDSYQKSYRLPGTERTLAIRVRMAHAHGGPGEKPEEIHAFAERAFKGGAPLVRITGQGAEKETAWATFESKTPVLQAELEFTKDGGKWQKRMWETAPATIDGARATATVPEGARVFYLNLIDDRKLVVSTEHVERN